RPSMRGVGACEPFLSWRRNGPDIAADVERREPEAAQRRDHDIGEVLAHPAALVEGGRRRRADLRGVRVVDEIRADAARQLQRRRMDGPSVGEALARVSRGLVEKRYASRRIKGDGGAVRGEKINR